MTHDEAVNEFHKAEETVSLLVEKNAEAYLLVSFEYCVLFLLVSRYLILWNVIFLYTSCGMANVGLQISSLLLVVSKDMRNYFLYTKSVV